MKLRTDEIRKMDPAELARELESARKELFNLRFRLSTRQLTNYREIRAVRKKIARIQTVMREKELFGG